MIGRDNGRVWPLLDLQAAAPAGAKLAARSAGVVTNGWRVALALLLACAIPSASADAAKRHNRTSHAIALHVASPAAQQKSEPPAAADALGDDLSYSDEYERAELIEQMLNECRGISYNAYELSRTSGESLWLPAPMELMVVRIHHPWCARLLRTYAPKTGV